VGLLELLWHTTASLTPRGNIGSLDDDHIAEELYWDGETPTIVNALVKTGWLDRCITHRLVVRGWEEHADQTVKRRNERYHEGFVTAEPIASHELVSDESQTSLPEARSQSQKPVPVETKRAGDLEGETSKSPIEPDPEPHAELHRKPHGRPPFSPTPEAQATLDLLLWAIEESLPGASVPDTGSPRWRRWCQELDRLHRLGEKRGGKGFPWTDIQAVIQWLPTHVKGDFAWGRVIRSASKLRQHFSRLLAEARAAPAQGRPSWRDAAKQVHREMMETGDG
jgi:hypothetical protein